MLRRAFALIDLLDSPFYRHQRRGGAGHRSLSAERMSVTANGRHRYEVVLFDLDGTLTDSRPGITRCVQHALARFEIIVEDPNELTAFVGPPLAESFGRFYGFDAEQSRKAIAVYRERFAAVGLFENAVYPGVPEMLAELAGAGTTLAIASSKPTLYVERILEHFELSQHFAYVAGSNLDHTRVAKDEVIAHALSLLPVADTRRVVMVGDREHDILGARAHGLESIAVAYGYGTAEELRGAEPLAIAETVEELTALLTAIG
jgi:phosphoglycolate phosphatase